MANVRPINLPDAGQLNQNSAFVVDTGEAGTVGKINATGIVDFAAPVASTSEAQVGTENTKRMTPLRVKESIASEVGKSIASADQGALATNAVPKTRKVNTEKGIVGGGDLSADRTLGLDDRSYNGISAFYDYGFPAYDSTKTYQISSHVRYATAGVSRIYYSLKADNTDNPTVKESWQALTDIQISQILATGTPGDNTYLRGDGSWSTVTSEAGGTVTSVAFRGPDGTVTMNSPITTVGEIAVDWDETHQAYTKAEATKLGGVEDGAQKNLPVGTGAGTVAAGNDSRIVNAGVKFTKRLDYITGTDEVYWTNETGNNVQVVYHMWKKQDATQVQAYLRFYLEGSEDPEVLVDHIYLRQTMNNGSGDHRAAFILPVGWTLHYVTEPFNNTDFGFEAVLIG